MVMCCVVSKNKIFTIYQKKAGYKRDNTHISSLCSNWVKHEHKSHNNKFKLTLATQKTSNTWLKRHVAYTNATQTEYTKQKLTSCFDNIACIFMLFFLPCILCFMCYLTKRNIHLQVLVTWFKYSCCFFVYILYACYAFFV